MKVHELNSQKKNYCKRIGEIAKAVYANHGFCENRDLILDAFEAALKKDKKRFVYGVWLPDSVSGIPLNCGVYIDYVVDESLAVLVDTDARKPESLEADARACLTRGPFTEAVFIQFGKQFVCGYLLRQASGATVLEMCDPPNLDCAVGA